MLCRLQINCVMFESKILCMQKIKYMYFICNILLHTKRFINYLQTDKHHSTHPHHILYSDLFEWLWHAPCCRSTKKKKRTNQGLILPRVSYGQVIQVYTLNRVSSPRQTLGMPILYFCNKKYLVFNVSYGLFQCGFLKFH